MDMLSQGVGSISVIGPAGIQSTLDLMLPFTNRKYPALNVVEVDHFISPEKLVVQTEHFTVRIRPISVSESNSRVIAVAATIIVSAWHHTEQKNDVTMVSVFPMACYFETFPSLRAMVDESVADAVSEHGSVKHKMFLFTPLAVSSFDTLVTYETNAHPQEGHFAELLSLCGEHNAKGMYIAGNLSKSAFECGYSQRMISTLSYLCKPLFPDMILPAPDTQPSDTNADGGDYLRFAAPGLSMSSPISTSTSRTFQAFPETIFNTDESVVADIVEKCAAARSMYDSAVLPRLIEILAPPCRREHGCAPPPLPPLPPPMFPFGTFNVSDNVVLFPPPGFRPPVPPWSFSNALSLAVPEQPPSPMFFMDNRASASTNSLPSLGDDLSNVSTPSPQTNFAAASMLRANLLQKRKQQDRSGFMETCESTPRDTPRDAGDISSSSDMIQGYSEASECASVLSLVMEAPTQHPYLSMVGCAGAGPGDFEADNDVRVSPMKSLRLNDSSKQFTFNTADFSSSLKKKSSPIHKAAGGKARTDQHHDEHASDQQAENTAFAKSVFHVPPPNPFMDVCTVAFLGTGSATPSKYRNGSCIMLTLNGSQQRRKHSFSDFLSIDTGTSNSSGGGGSASGGGDSNSNGASFKPSILLDVGEGTAAQIFQSVNGDVARFDQALLSIRVIWISHHHADHITGVPMLIEHIKRAKMRQESASKGKTEGETHDSKNQSLRRVPTFSKYDMRSMYTSGGYEPGKVMVIGSESVLKYFEFSCCVAGLDDLVSFTPIVSTLYAGCTKEIAAATDGLITRLRSIPVQHCHSSYGLVLDFKSTHKIVYSGDCRPSQSLVKAGIDCDLLIHEATFDDSKQDDAVKKRHSTSSEARRISMQMHAKHTILTHFSQRYPLEVSNALGDLASTQGGLQEQGNSDGYPVGAMGRVTEAAVAYDFLRFSFPSQVSVLPRVTAALGAVLTAVEAERKALSASSSAGKY